MFLIPELLIKQLIESKLNYLRSNPDVINEIFVGAPVETQAEIRNYVVNNQIRVVRGYPRDPSVLPSFAVVLGNEREENQSLGNYVFDDTFGSKEVSGTGWNTQYRVEVWANNGDLVCDLYSLLKWIFLSGRDWLESEGLVRQVLGGTDFEPIPTYFPELVYRRALILEAMYEVRWSTPYTRITQIVDESALGE